ncbi:MAG TPA: hypothetical protein VIM99_09050 [Blastocatellia bacterium]
MRKSMIMILLAVVLPSAAAAQSKEYRGKGYVFVAPTVFTEVGGALNFGGGGEGLVYKGLGVGGEVGYLSPIERLSEGIGLFSINGSYNFRRSERVSPFLTGGPALALGRGANSALMNLGGGLHWWFKDRIGLRFEVRDHFTPESGASHAISFRIGLAFPVIRS